MLCPKCNANHFVKHLNGDGTHYYFCSACHYQTQIIKPSPFVFYNQFNMHKE